MGVRVLLLSCLFVFVMSINSRPVVYDLVKIRVISCILTPTCLFVSLVGMIYARTQLYIMSSIKDHNYLRYNISVVSFSFC